MEQEYKSIADRRHMTIEEVRKFYEEHNHSEGLKSTVAKQKLFDKLISEANVKQGEKISYAELVKTDNE